MIHDGKRVFITGASRGIGACIAKTLQSQGARVVTAARTDADILVDFSSEEATAQALSKLNDFDILINNVGGTLDVKNPFCGMEDWARVMRLNFGVAVQCVERLASDMMKKRWGRIINICSTSSLENNGPVPYCAAKAALAHYTRCMGRVMAPTGVVMSGLIVGAINTAGGFWERQTAEHTEEYLRTRCPTGKFGEERSIADFVSFLCSDAADFSHGALFTVDGGQVRGTHY